MFAARYWREIPQRYRMEAGKCARCGKVFFPPRLVCDACNSREFEEITLSDEGEIVSYTVIRTPPSGFEDEAPYAMGIIELDGGGRVTAQIVDVPFDQLKIGLRVRLEFRCIQRETESGVIAYGHKAVPLG